MIESRVILDMGKACATVDDRERMHSWLAKYLDGAPHQWCLAYNYITPEVCLTVRADKPLPADAFLGSRTRPIIVGAYPLPQTGQRIILSLDVNFRRSKTRPGRTSAKVPVSTRDEAVQMLRERLAPAATIPTSDDPEHHILVTAHRAYASQANGNKITIGYWRITCEATITNHEAFQQLVEQGIGNARAYGFGMIGWGEVNE